MKKFEVISTFFFLPLINCHDDSQRSKYICKITETSLSASSSSLLLYWHHFHVYVWRNYDRIWDGGIRLSNWFHGDDYFLIQHNLIWMITVINILYYRDNMEKSAYYCPIVFSVSHSYFFSHAKLTRTCIVGFSAIWLKSLNYHIVGIIMAYYPL